MEKEDEKTIDGSTEQTVVETSPSNSVNERLNDLEVKVANMEQLLITLVSKQDELLNKIKTLTNEQSELKGQTDSMDMKQKFSNLPVPKLRLGMDVKNWFRIYENAMTFVDESVMKNKRTLLNFVGYYISDEVAVLYSKVQCNHHYDYYYFKRNLNSEIYRKNCEEGCKKEEIEREKEKAKQLSTSYMERMIETSYRNY